MTVQRCSQCGMCLVWKRETRCLSTILHYLIARMSECTISCHFEAKNIYNNLEAAHPIFKKGENEGKRGKGDGEECFPTGILGHPSTLHPQLWIPPILKWYTSMHAGRAGLPSLTREEEFSQIQCIVPSRLFRMPASVLKKSIVNFRSFLALP